MRPLTVMTTCRLADRPRDVEITRIFAEGVESFFATTRDVGLVVVDDGSTTAHRAAIERLAAQYPLLRPVFRPANGGGARAKNTGLRIFEESDAEHLFLADDDVLFLRAGWQEAYRAAMRATGYRFLSFFEDHTDTMVERGPALSMDSRVSTVHGVRLKSSPLVMGAFRALDREVLRRVGGFRVFPCKYGHWDTEHAFRCVDAGLGGATFTDIADSDRYVRLNTQASVYTPEEKLAMARENAALPLRGGETWSPIVE